MRGPMDYADDLPKVPVMTPYVVVFRDLEQAHDDYVVYDITRSMTGDFIGHVDHWTDDSSQASFEASLNVDPNVIWYQEDMTREIIDMDLEERIR